MSRNWARFLAGIVAVAIVWIAAYWWLNPREPSKISFGGAPKEAPIRTVSNAPPPKPRTPVAIVDIKREPFKSPSSLTGKAPAPQPQPQATKPLAPRAEAPKAAEPVKSPEAPKQTESSKPAVIPPRFDDYTVRSGDSLSSIATKRLGSAKHVDSLRRSNPLKDMDKLKPGDVIKIPLDPANIQGKPAPGAPPPEPPPERQGEMLEYTVKSGDTLSKIAKEKYGSTTYQDWIFQANRDRLRSPGSLREGQKLRLPKKPAT